MPGLVIEGVPGAPCVKVVNVASMIASIRGRSGSGESTIASAKIAVSLEGAFALEAEGSISFVDRYVSSQVAECREPAVLMQSIQQKRSPTGCQPTRGQS